MTTSFHSPLTIHRENTPLPPPSLHVSPWPVTPSGAWQVRDPCRPAWVTLAWSRHFCKLRASSTRCLPVSLVLEGTPLVVLPRETLCKLYFTSYGLRNLRSRTQKGLVTDLPSPMATGRLWSTEERWEWDTGHTGLLLYLQDGVFLLSTVVLFLSSNEEHQFLSQVLRQGGLWDDSPRVSPSIWILSV